MVNRMQGFRDEADLEDWLSRPSPADVETVKAHPGDLMILGAGGKMGPTLALRIRRAVQQAGTGQRVFAVSRFEDRQLRDSLTGGGIEVIPLDLMRAGALATLPPAPNLLYLAGRKFGSSGNAALTWAMNVLLPGRVAEHFRDSRIVALSSGNIYPFLPVTSPGANEDTPVGPVGEYAQSVLGRERMFEHGAIEYGTRVVNLRLNYALEPRYGVLADLGLKVWKNEPVDIGMPAVNIIWQGDANSYALQSLSLCQSPAAVLNLAGGEVLRVHDLALAFAQRWNKEPRFTGREAATALLNDSTKCRSLFGEPLVGWRQMLDWTAHWIETGGRSLGKPTHFEARDGKF